jgi:hypothetical protein
MVALNADTGWAGGINENATVAADRPFRVRFEVAGSTAATVQLQYRRNGGEWAVLDAQEFPYSDLDDSKSPRVSIVTCDAYPNGAATTDLLAGAAAPFQAGVGVSLADRAAAPPGAGRHTELEWALVVRRYADGPVSNEEGDTFEFRLVDAGNPLGAQSVNPVLSLAIPPGHLGGTFVETPGRIGPWQATNGDLYFIMEPAETENVFMMMKSTDQGRTWREVDAARRPATDDLESVDSRQVGDTIHIIHQITESVRYHTFRTSDHPAHPDTWDIRDELAATVESIAQAATLVVRSDQSLVTFYVGPTVQYSIRSPKGSWSATRPLRPNLAGPQAVLGANDTVHVAGFATDGTIWYRRLSRSGVLTPAMPLATGAGTTRAEYGAVLPLVFIPETNTVVILYRLSDGRLWERRIVNEGAPSPPLQVTDRDVIRHAVDSQQPAADVVRDGTTLRVLFVDASSRDLFSTENAGAGWQPSVAQVPGIVGTWIRGQVFARPDGARVLGYVYDAGSEGGSGMNRYGEMRLP